MEIVVLRQKIHGLSGEDCAAALRERLDHDVRLARTPAEEREMVPDADVVVGFDVDTDCLSDSISLFACVFAGTGHLDLKAFEEHGISVTNASGVHGPNIAEHVLGAILSFARQFHVGRRQQERNEWRSYPSRELMGSTVTVVGLGAIGTTVVDRLDAFDVETLGVRYTPEKGGPTDEVFGFEEIHDPLSRSEYVVLACPLTDATEGLIDGEAFRTMPSESVLVNIARGPVVETDKLVKALRSNAIRGAALDVTDPEPLPNDHPLWDFGNVQITPHNAGHTPRYYDRFADILSRNVSALPEGELENQVV